MAAAYEESTGTLKQELANLSEASIRITFGMLIEFLFEKFPDWENANDQAISDLEAFYKDSKTRFDSDPAFKEREQRGGCQSPEGGEEKYRKAWKQICEISRKGYQKVYERLGVHLDEKGESFNNPYIPKVMDFLDKKGLIEDNDGARVIFVKPKEDKVRPLIVIKNDGGFNYASTGLAALWNRLNEEQAEWIIYLTDVGQHEHFEMVFAAAKQAGWLPADDKEFPRVNHVGFGLVLGDDGKRFRTRSTEVGCLVDLLDEAKRRCKAALIDRGKGVEWTEEELEQTAEAVGYGAVKYADLKNNRLTNYTFNPDQMLNDKVGTIELIEVAERVLGLHILQVAEIVEEAFTNLLPSLLREYLYNLSEDFTGFYSTCQVLDQQRKQVNYCFARQLQLS